jgi:predicted nucleotidyltransferase
MSEMAKGSIELVTRGIVQAFHPRKIILFGSRARGSPGPDSDIDLLVIMDSSLPAGRRAAKIYRLLGARPFSLDVLVYTPKEIQERLARFDPFLEDIMKNGRVLYEAG